MSSSKKMTKKLGLAAAALTLTSVFIGVTAVGIRDAGAESGESLQPEPPAVLATKDAVYIAVGNCVYARDPALGTELWTVTLTSGTCPSLAIDKDVLYVGLGDGQGMVNIDAYAVALDAGTGLMIWETPLPDPGA